MDIATDGKSSASPWKYEEINMRTGERVKEYHSGLTKREYFAAMAMQGALSSSVGGAFREIDHKYFAEHAVKFADALIQALNSKRGE